MNMKAIRIISGIGLAIQLLGVLLTVILSIVQGSRSLSAFCMGGIPLLFYILFFCCLFLASYNNTRLAAGVFLGIGCLLYYACPYISVIENMVTSRLVSVEAFAGAVAFNSACYRLCTPLYTIAFALFCFVAGGYFCYTDSAAE